LTRWPVRPRDPAALRGSEIAQGDPPTHGWGAPLLGVLLLLSYRPLVLSVRAVVIDPNPLVRSVLRVVLADRMVFVVGEGSSLEDLLKLCDDEQADVVVADCDLPDGSLDEHVPELRASGIAVVVFCGDRSSERLTSLLHAGVDGVLMRDAAPESVADIVIALAGDRVALNAVAAHTVVGGLRRLRADSAATPVEVGLSNGRKGIRMERRYSVHLPRIASQRDAPSSRSIPPVENSDEVINLRLLERTMTETAGVGEAMGVDALLAHREERREIRLSIVMPAHNEERTIGRGLHRLLSTALPCEVEIIVVDDGSTDRTPEVLQTMSDSRLSVQTHPRNLGKGAAVLTGAQVASGTHLLVFDADLEYSPNDIPPLLEPILRGDADVVYGTRLFGANTVYHSFRYALGNRLTTLAANVLFDACLSDLHTCLKLIPLPLFRDLSLRESGFGLDTEITAGLLRRGVRPFEVPISYVGRTHAEGKQIRWQDGVRCLAVLARVRLAQDRRANLALPASLAVTEPDAWDELGAASELLGHV